MRIKKFNYTNKVFGNNPICNAEEFIDLRSDVVTMPTAEMLNEMFHAKIGNDGWGEDPTVNKLQKKFAEMLGKEDSIYVPSGSMGNLLAIMCHTGLTDEVIVDAKSHIFLYGVAAGSTVASVQLRPINTLSGYITLNEVIENIREDGF